MNNSLLKKVRREREKTGEEMGKAIGLSTAEYFHKEHGHVRFTLREALSITCTLQLTEGEFCDIFFDGYLPYLSENDKYYKFCEKPLPLREARKHIGYTVQEMADAMEMSLATYKQRENGSKRCSLDECRAISELLELSLQDFNDIFFNGSLPFGKAAD